MNKLLAAVLLAAFFAALLPAQTPTGSIVGTITDQSGAVVPHASVTVTESGTARSIATTSNTLGYWEVRNLLPGTYSVRIEAPGFAARDVRNLTVNAGAVVSANTTLEVGKTGEVIEVSAQAVSVDTSRQTVDSVVTESEIKELPLFSRNFLDLAALAPGVTIRDGGAIDPTKTFAYRAVSVSGSSGTGTRVQIDGIDVTDETVGTTTANLSDEAVSQFQLTRSSLDISTSLTSTGAVNVITKSGTNQFHGSGFYDFYNQDLGARLQYNSTAEPNNRKRFGGALGGPIIKNRLFFFGNFERTYQNAQSIWVTPTFPQLNVSQPFPTGIRYGLGRVDWNITPSVRAFYKFQNNWDVSTGGTAVSPFQNIDWTNTHAIGLDIAKGRTANTIRFGYTNFNNNIASEELKQKFPSFNGTPYFLGVGAFQAGPNDLAPQATYQDNWQISYDGSFMRGRHTFRYGLSFTHVKLGGFANFAGPLTINGTYDGPTLDALKAAAKDITDPLNYPFQSFSMGPANGFFSLAACHNLPHGCHINNRTAFFGGDTIKITRNFTLNLGVRYEYDSGYFPNDRRVVREPDLELYGQGFSQFPEAPRNMWSPSIGFAWDPTGSGKTSLRAGFYRAFEGNILNNIMFDEYAMLPPGIGPDVYDNTFVSGPDGTPINVANHPGGDYSDLVGQPVSAVLPLIIQVNSALQAAYRNYKFDPQSGASEFKIAKGNTFGYQLPGNQFKAPYAIQGNIGIQRELWPGTVLSVDYIYNHGIGLPFLGVDYEDRLAYNTLNVAAAQSKVNAVLNGMTADQYLAAHPGTTIDAFKLATDSVFQGKTAYYTRARLFQNGFTKYQALQVSLTGRAGTFLKLRDTQYQISYSRGLAEATAGASRAEFLTGAQDNFHPNARNVFGPTGNDFRHILNAAWIMNVPGGFQINSTWHFRSPPPIDVFVPNLSGATSGANALFSTDLNGDGGTGTTPRGDVFPGVDMGQFGRGVSSFKQLNRIIQNFNQKYAGQLTPAGQALVNAGIFTVDQMKQIGAVISTVPLVPANAPNPFHNMFTTDVRLTRPIRFGESLKISPFFDVFNLFNHAPSASYGGLGATFGSFNYDYVNAGPGSQASDLTHSLGRLNDTRQMQFGIRVDF